MNKLFSHPLSLQLLCGAGFLCAVFGWLLVAKQSFESRELYRQIETVYRDRVGLETLQGQLRIELSSLVSPASIEAQARQELIMQAPVSEQLSLTPGVATGTRQHKLSMLTNDQVGRHQ